MVGCFYVGICFGVEHHHMPDRVLHLAWRTKDYIFYIFGFWTLDFEDFEKCNR